MDESAVTATNLTQCQSRYPNPRFRIIVEQTSVKDL